MQSLPQGGGGSGDGGIRARSTEVSELKAGRAGGSHEERESPMMELTRVVQKVLKESSWWERRGLDCSILGAAFLSLPPGKKRLPTKVKEAHEN